MFDYRGRLEETNQLLIHLRFLRWTSQLLSQFPCEL